MGIRNIRFDGDPVLKRECDDIMAVDGAVQQLLDDMLETMYRNSGVGLAAPQVGIPKNLIVVDVGSGPLQLINPRIIEKSDATKVEQEGCLSLPGFAAYVERPKKVKVQALDRNGEETIIEAKKLLARALCHEIDHLHGITIKDRAKMRNFSNGEQQVDA